MAVRKGLNSDNELCMEGLRIGNGPLPFDEKIKRHYDADCVECDGDDGLHGVYEVGVTEYGVGVVLYRSVDFVNFRCVSCLHETDPIKYPNSGLQDEHDKE